MRESLRSVIRVTSGDSVREKLLSALAGLNIVWEGDDTFENIAAKLKKGLFYFPTDHPKAWHWSKARLRQRKGDAPLWFERYMPPISYYCSSVRIGWHILLSDVQQSVDGSLVREVVSKGAEKRLAAWDIRNGLLQCEPMRYPTLVSERGCPAWIAMQLLIHANRRKVNLCDCCNRYDWEDLPTSDSCIAIVTGVGTKVVQADWLVYRSVRR